MSPGVHASGLDFSAYLRSKYVSVLHERGVLDLAELDTRLNQSVQGAKEKLGEHFRARVVEKANSLVDEWKRERVYPYSEEPAGVVEVVERQVFDIVAVNIATSLPDFQTQFRRTRG
jgi:hypothetical protein